MYDPVAIFKDDFRHGHGIVEFFSPTSNGAFIFIESKFIQFEISKKKGLLESFAESIRKANFNAKLSKREAYYNLTGTLAVCQTIRDNDSGHFLNPFPIVLLNWEKYGIGV